MHVSAHYTLMNDSHSCLLFLGFFFCALNSLFKSCVAQAISVKLLQYWPENMFASAPFQDRIHKFISARFVTSH